MPMVTSNHLKINAYAKRATFYKISNVYLVLTQSQDVWTVIKKENNALYVIRVITL